MIEQAIIIPPAIPISTASFILMLSSVLTGLVVEAIKRMVGIGTIKNLNLLTAIVSVVVGAIIPIAYIVINKIPFSPDIILYIFGIIGLSWLIAMVGYDKVIQTIMQVRK